MVEMQNHHHHLILHHHCYHVETTVNTNSRLNSWRYWRARRRCFICTRFIGRRWCSIAVVWCSIVAVVWCSGIITWWRCNYCRWWIHGVVIIIIIFIITVDSIIITALRRSGRGWQSSSFIIIYCSVVFVGLNKGFTWIVPHFKQNWRRCLAGEWILIIITAGGRIIYIGWLYLIMMQGE